MRSGSTFLMVIVVTAAGLLRAGAARAGQDLFELDRIVDIQIEIAPGGWQRLRRQTRAPGAGYATETFGPAPKSPFTWFSSSVTIDGRRFDRVGVRKKGFVGSLDEHRPSLRLDLGRADKRIRLQGLRRLVLNNGREGPSVIRQCLAYRVFAAAGYPASRCGFAHVRVDGEDLGAYALVEPVDKVFLRRHYGQAATALFEGAGSDFRPGWLDTFEAKNKAARRQRKALASLSAALTRPDAALLDALEPLLDLDAFLSYWALEVLVGQLDGYAAFANNFFVVRAGPTGRFQFLPWGMDKVMAYPDQVGPSGPLTIYSGSILTVRLGGIPEVRKRYERRLLRLVDRVWVADRLLAEQRVMEAAVLPVMLPAQRKAYGFVRGNLVDYLRRRGAVIRAGLGRAETEPIHELLPPPSWRVRLKGGKPAQRQGSR